MLVLFLLIYSSDVSAGFDFCFFYLRILEFRFSNQDNHKELPALVDDVHADEQKAAGISVPSAVKTFALQRICFGGAKAIPGKGHSEEISEDCNIGRW